MSGLPKRWDRSLCEKYHICPIYDRESIDGLYISPETDLSVLGFFKFREKRQLCIVGIDPDEMTGRMQDLFGSVSDANASSSVNHNGDNRIGSDHSIIRLIDDIIGKGISIGASDIHFEPFERNMICRYRVDGVLRHDRNIARDSVAEVVARIKIMSGLDISERRRPQDGRIRFKTGDKVVDIRVSVLPTDFGEKAVLRLLDKETLRLDLGLLGLTDSQRSLLEQKITLPNGMILVTGPTGSGKTTTLYAVLNRLRSPDVNITTIEDPIEYNLEGINQTHIRPEINLTFGNALRAILRQDPNIIMVGEIRDRETLDQAIRASLTGHLVLSTLHTNDAVATITRMLDLGAESYLLGSTIKLIVAQRLVQTICPHCKTEKHDAVQEAAAMKLGFESGAGFAVGEGCPACAGTGYLGRKAIFEMLPVDSGLAGVISGGGSENEMRAFAGERDFHSLKQAGIQLIGKGLTTPAEVLRAVAD